MQTLSIVLRNSTGSQPISETDAALALPCAFTIGRVVRFKALDIPGITPNTFIEEIYGRVTVPFNAETSAFTVELNNEETDPDFIIRECNLQCPSCEHCCGNFAETTQGIGLPGFGSSTDPLIVPVPVDQDGNFFARDAFGNPIIPRLLEIEFLELIVNPGASTTIIPIGSRPIAVYSGEWGISISGFNSDTGAVFLSAIIPPGAVVKLVYTSPLS
jgi:hypothetical protein